MSRLPPNPTETKISNKLGYLSQTWAFFFQKFRELNDTILVTDTKPDINTTQIWYNTTSNSLYVYNGTDWSIFNRDSTEAL